MKPFRKLLLAPVALGLLAPAAAQANDLASSSPGAAISNYMQQHDLDRFRAWESQNQVTSINQFSDVRPSDWAYQALTNLIERYGCVAGYPAGSFKGGQAMSRYEAAALLNACLDRVTEETDELRRLIKEFEAELAVLKGRLDKLDAKVGQLEASQFSTTTKLQGEATFVLGTVQGYGDGGPTPVGGVSGSKLYNAQQAATTFSYDLRLNFLTSFNSKDLLYTRLRAGNFANAFNGGASGTGGNSLNLTALDKGFNSDGNVQIDRLYYRFPVGKEFEFLVGARARNTEFLGAPPSVYGTGKGDKILDFFAVNGTPGVYNKATGAAAGVIWKQQVPKGRGRFSGTVNYVAPNGNLGATDAGAPGCQTGDNEGGIASRCSASSFLAQVGYTAPQWGVAAGYRYGQRYSNFRRGSQFAAGVIAPGAANNRNWWLQTGNSNSFALNAYWQPKDSGWIPSISAGWGINSLSGNGQLATGADYPAIANANLPADTYVEQSQSWFVGLQWNDAFAKGNALGMAVGQPTYATSLSRGGANDGNYVWEWFYKVQVTDNIAVTPSLFYLSRPYGQLTSNGEGDSFGVLGALVQTTFKF